MPTRSAQIAVSPADSPIEMIEFVGFDVSGDPMDAAAEEELGPDSALRRLMPDAEDRRPDVDPRRPMFARRVAPEAPPVEAGLSVTTGGVAWIPAGELSVTVAVGAGFPAIAASHIGTDDGVGVSVVTVDGYGTAMIDLNRPSSSDVQITWFVVHPSGGMTTANG
jgi:hypothetical protein